MPYKYESDRAKRREARNLLLEQANRKYRKSNPLPSGWTEIPAMPRSYSLSDLLDVVAGSLKCGIEVHRLDADIIPLDLHCERLADNSLNDLDSIEQQIVVNIDRLKASPYGDLAARIRLLSVGLRRQLAAIEDSLIAHLARTQGFKPDGDMFKPMYEKASSDYLADLEYLSVAVEATLGTTTASSRPALNGKPLRVYEMLVALPEHKAMLPREICDQLSTEHGISCDESALARDVKPELLAWGLKTKSRVGWWLEKSA